ncbi:MAG: 4-oxalocrotonate tautomerase family protein [Candidatus Methylomirabilales bacterium]
MPVVTIRLLEGRTLDQKRELTAVISEAVSRIAKTPLEGVHVIFEDVPRSDWGRGGILFADRDPR